MKVKYIHIEVEILEIRRQYFINNIRNRFPHKIEYYFLTKSKTKMFRKDKLVRTPTLKKNAKSNQVGTYFDISHYTWEFIIHNMVYVHHFCT